MSYRIDRSGRTVRAAVVLLAVWAGILALWSLVDMATWITGLLLAITLPAAFDFVTARPAGIEMDDRHLRWWSGRHHGDTPLEALHSVRFETRLDLSPRVRLVLQSGQRVPLPQDSLPRDPETLKSAFEARGVATERHPFSLL